MLAALLIALFAAVPRAAFSWTSVSPDRAQVTVALSSDGSAAVRTTVRFEVQGGSFHGFDLAALPGAALRIDQCLARTDSGVAYGLSAEEQKDGRTRLSLADNAEMSKGAITFELLHEIDLIEQDNLRVYEGRARLDFTPLVWDWGFERMSFRLELPGPSKDAPIVLDPTTTADYEIELNLDAVVLTKFRAVRWYPMRVIASFDPNLIGRLAIGGPSAPGFGQPSGFEATPVAASTAPAPAPLLPLAGAFAVVLCCLATLWRKAYHVHRVYEQVGLAARFAVLPHTGIALRAALSTGAVLGGVAVQLWSSVAAGVPAIAAGALLLLTARTTEARKPRPGGSWRALDDAQESRYRSLSAAYGRSRTCIVDISTLRGAATFVLFLAKLSAVAYVLRGELPRLAWIVMVDGLLLGVSAWFSNVRSELPHDILLEAFPLLDKWRKTARKLLGKDGAQIRLWVREDESGPLEVRLRMPGKAEGLRGIEVAGEAVASGTTRRIRPAFVARFDAGAAKARALATSALACDHHLSPDCAEEIVVLRSRRGKDGALAPLRTALAL
jgi:hypothetical protein